MNAKLSDEAGLRLAFAVAKRAHSHGNHPFGCVLVGPQGDVMLEAENGFMPDRDMTAHAERLLATAASRKFRPVELSRRTMYTSAEPCAMCAGAVYWAGIGRVVYGLSEARLKQITRETNHPQPRGESDLGPALPYGIFSRPAQSRGHRAAARG
jgi:tRNA(Arg) A34 adenosine deaminase TadA